MKKKIICALLLTVSMAMTGCGSLVSLPEISEEEEELITEYAAGLILKYDTKFAAGNLLDEDVLVQQEAKEKEARAKERAYKKSAEEYLAKKEAAKKESDKKSEAEKAEANSTSQDASADTDQTIDNIATFYGIDGFSVSYTGYELCDSYSDSIMMDVDADPGKQLAVLEFEVTNVSSETKNFDMFYKGPNFYLSIDGAKKVKMQSTLMFDDMSSFVGEIPAGGSQSMILLFEIDENISSIGNMILTAKNGSQKGSVTLQ